MQEQARLTNLESISIWTPDEIGQGQESNLRVAIPVLVASLAAAVVAGIAMTLAFPWLSKQIQAIKLSGPDHFTRFAAATEDDAANDEDAAHNGSIAHGHGLLVFPPTQSSHWSSSWSLPVSSRPFGRRALGPPPGEHASIPAKLRYLQSQITSIGTDAVILDRFRLLEPHKHQRGGQAVVAFARGTYDQREYALKFFVDRQSFLTEQGIYCNRALAPLLPHMHDAYDPQQTPKGLIDSRGQPLPPCIVMERGEPLPDWLRRAKPDMFQAVAMIGHVAARLRDMHDAGYVHRDIKPGNLMLLPRAYRWTLIDFGCVARVGEEAQLSYTLTYAAPEIAAAVAAGRTSIVAHPAMDAWALGVVAYELFTGQAAFSMMTEGRDGVMDRLLGEKELPWEQGVAANNPVIRRRLGVFRKPVLSLLRRDPALRATLAEFCRDADNVFSTSTTIGAPMP